MGSAEIGRGQIEKYADEAVAREEIRKYLDVAARFPQMPWYNVLLILEQMPGAEILCGIRAWKKYGAVLRQGEKPVMLLSPVAARQGEQLCMGDVGVYDSAQVKLAVNTSVLKMPLMDAGVEDALRERCGLVIMEDKDGGFLRSKALKSCFSREERTVYVRPGLPDAVRDVELMKCYVKYAVGKSVGDMGNQRNTESRMDAGRCAVQQGSGAAVYGMIGEYRDMAEDYLAYLLCKYFHLPEYPLRIIPSGLFGVTAERKGRFLCGLSALFFGAVKELTGKKMLGFNETMFCNLFFTEPDRERVLENLGRFLESSKPVDGMIVSDLLAFQRDIGRKEKFSDGEIKGIYEKRLARELFSFPPVIYGE